MNKEKLKSKSKQFALSVLNLIEALPKNQTGKIISNQLISMILAQISEEQDIKLVYDDLFQEAGLEIYIKPASLYFTSFPIEATFADMMRLAHRRQEVCLGLKIKMHEKDINRNFGIKLIPEKNTKYILQAEDALVVLAEDET